MAAHLSQPIVELPVADVVSAQVYYRDRMGFQIAWHNEAGKIGAVSLGDCAVFFRQTSAPIVPVTLWMFSKNVDAAHAELTRLGAEVVTPLEDTEWDLRQFTVRDLNGHLLHVFTDP